jgi:hypothetical protein
MHFCQHIRCFPLKDSMDVSRSDDFDDRSIELLVSDELGSLYQRLLPPRGAELEEVKPPNNVLIRSISDGTEGGIQTGLTTTSTATTPAISASTISATTASTAIPSHLSKTRIDLLLCLGKDGHEITSLLLV